MIHISILGVTYNMPQNSDARFGKLTLLSKSETRFPDSPQDAVLETFENVYSRRDYEITFHCPEFTSLCPVTGQPDFGDITIKYIPDKLCIESKSLKIFLFSFRNHNTFHEEAVNTILDEVVEKAAPKWAEVTGVFRPRGGIALTIKADYTKTDK
jgi:7-cyano-7-deazaguanine reductase